MLVSPIASGAMAQVLYCAAEALHPLVELSLVAPASFHPPPSLYTRFFPLPTPRNRLARAAYWFSPKSVKDVLRIVRRERPDLIHFMNGIGYLPAVLVPKLVPDIPCVMTVHDPVAHSGAHVDILLNVIARHAVLPHVNVIEVLSESSRRALVQLGFGYDKIWKNRLGAVTDVFVQYNDPNVSREDSLLFFGRWEHYKGIDILVDAILLLAAQGVEQRCILAGPGSVSKDLYKKIASRPDLFEVHNRYLSDQEVAILLQRANRLVLPYRDASQSCLPALAQAYKLLLIATSVGAFTEEVNEIGGLLVSPGSVSELAAAIDQSSRLQAPLEERIDYSWKSVAEDMIKMYSKATL